MTPKNCTGNDSRCCQPDGAPYEWEDHIDETHPATEDIINQLKALPPFNRREFEKQINALYRLAVNGELVDTEDASTPIKPINLDPEIFELRHAFLKMKIRIYHAEPAPEPTKLVRLHIHDKATTSQQKNIEHASQKYTNMYN